jgi:WD40 repeat protein
MQQEVSMSSELLVSRRLFLAALLASPAALARAQISNVLSPWRTIDLPVDSQVGEPSVVTAVAISPDGAWLAAAGDDHLVHLWSLADGRLLASLRGHADWVRSVVFHPGGGQLASAGDDRRVLLWELPSGRLLRSINDHAQAVYSISYSPDGRTLATVGFDSQMRLYDATGGPLSTLNCPCADMRAVAFSPDGRLMAAAGRNGKLRVWDMTTSTVAFERDVQDRRVRDLVFSNDGSQLALGGDGQFIHLLQARSGEEILRLPSRPGRVLSLAYCGDSKLAAGNSDNSIGIWNLTYQQQEQRLVGHRGSVSALAYHPASSVLVSGSYDTTVRIWNLASSGPTTTRKPERYPGLK